MCADLPVFVCMNRHSILLKYASLHLLTIQATGFLDRNAGRGRWVSAQDQHVSVLC